MKPRQTVVVQGRYPFPWDMLRLDRATPATIDDSATLAEVAGVDPQDLDQRRKLHWIKFNIYSRAGATAGRWRSFGWACWDLEDPNLPPEAS